MKKSQKSGGGVTGMEWDDREMRETSIGKRRKREFEVRSDQMDVGGEQEEEEDAGREKKRVKLSVGPVGRGKGRAVREEKEWSRKSAVMGKGKSKRKQVDHVEDEDAIFEHSSYLLIINLPQMHLYVRVLSPISRVSSLFFNICTSIATILTSFPIIPVFLVPFPRDSRYSFQLA